MAVRTAVDDDGVRIQQLRTAVDHLDRAAVEQLEINAVESLQLPAAVVPQPAPVEPRRRAVPTEAVRLLEGLGVMRGVAV